MPGRHRHDEVMFEIPNSWGFNGVLVAPAPAGAPRGFATNLVVTRGQLQPSETLGAYADRQVVELTRSMKKFHLRTRSDVTVAGVPAVQLRCAWHGVEGPVETEITMLVRAASAILFTATVPKNQADKMLPLFRAVLSGVQFDDTFTP